MSGIKESAISRTVFGSPITSQSLLRPPRGAQKKKISTGLLLTSLVDSFSILVIFLIMNSSSSYQVKLDSKIKLPAALAGQQLEKSPVLKIRESRYYLNDEEVGSDQLSERLGTAFPDEMRQEDSLVKPSLIVLADRNLPFTVLNPLLIAASQAGVQELKFAVINKK